MSTQALPQPVKPIMTRTIAAHFDGKFIVPDEPVDLPVGKPLVVRLDMAAAEPKFAALLSFATDLPGAPTDLSVRHDEHVPDPSNETAP